MRLKWTKSGKRWMGIYGAFRAEIEAPNPEHVFSMWHWYVYRNKKSGGSGGTSSLASAKQCAESEVSRLIEWLKGK